MRFTPVFTRRPDVMLFDGMIGGNALTAEVGPGSRAGSAVGRAATRVAFPGMPDRELDEVHCEAVDLNADLGESFGRWVLGDDDAMLEVVTSANVACGFHAGDPLTLRNTLAAAAAAGVTVGAQVGYQDLAGFGRRFIDLPPADLTAGVIYQLGALAGLAGSVGTAVRYVKPHGALYNTIVHHRAQAEAVVAAVLAYDAGLPVVGLPGSEFLRQAAAAGLSTVREAFADRAYTAAGTLVPRTESGAVLHDPAGIAARVVRLVSSGEVEAVTGEMVPVQADSICVHGDSPGAVAIATAVRAALSAAGVQLRPFAD